MARETLVPFQPTFEIPKHKWQGRSKKQLHPVVQYRGGIYVARCEGRPNIYFGTTEKEALNNMRCEQ